MQGVAEMFGRQGPNTNGDPHVAELLKRTYTKYREVQENFKSLRDSNFRDVKATYTLTLPEMTVLHGQWLSSILWQMALVYTDGVIVMFTQSDALPEEAYQVGDTLCDDAASRARQAVRTQAQFTDTGRVPLSQMAEMPKLPVNRWCYVGTWNACNELVDQVKDDLDAIIDATIPARMADIHAALAKGFRTHITAVQALRQDWRSTSMADNQMELTKELLGHTTEIFKIGQQLWAPYLVGPKFAEALKKEKTLDELGLGFDPWILTDPRKKAAATADAGKAKELIGFWESVSNTGEMQSLTNEVAAALQSGAIRRRVSRGYDMVPWQSQFLVIRRITLGGQAFEPGQLCAYYPGRIPGGTVIQIRRAGKVTNVLELLGQI